MKRLLGLFLSLKNWTSKNKILTIILVLAAVLRFGGIYPSFPPTHPDESAIYGGALMMIYHTSLDPMRYDYGALPMIINAIVYVIINPFFIVYSFIFTPENLPKFQNALYFFQQILRENQLTAVLYWARSITAVFGVGIVFMVYLVAKKYFSNKKVALVAAFLTAVNYRQVLNSHMVLPDIYSAFFLLVVFYILANLLRKPTRKNYILSGILIGVSISVKFQPFAIVPFVFIHLIHTWLSLKQHSVQNIIKNKKILLKYLFKFDFILAMLAIPIVFIMINPFIFSNWEEFTAINHYSALQYKMGINNLSIFPISYLYHTGIGQTISIFILLGIFWGLKKYTVNTLVYLSIVIPFFYVLVYYGNGGFYTRNFVTITPLLLIFAALFLVELPMLVGNYLKIGIRFINFLIIFLLAAISWGQFKNSITTTYYFSQPQNYRVAYMWAQNNIPEGSIIAANTDDRFPKKKQFEVVNFEYNDTYSLTEMQEKGVDYGYLSLGEFSTFFYWWMHQDTKQGLVYWNKSVPDSISQNMFPAKVAKEHASWAVASFIKPWQVPDLNRLIVKVPEKLNTTNKKILKEFSFDAKDDLSSWFLINGYEDRTKSIVIDQSQGHTTKGAVRFNAVATFPNLMRAVSPIIPLENSTKNLAYEITGWIKTESALSPRDRDGFLQVDFYETDPKIISFNTKSSDVALSSRVYGTNEWIQKNITVIAPKNAKFMTVTLGVNTHTAPIWFDDIAISQSQDFFEDPRAAPPYLNYYQIPENIVFPVSHGNF